jgi:hypothetical protein
MMKIIMNRLKKCVHPTQAGMPGLTPEGTWVPGYRWMNAYMAGILCRPPAHRHRGDQEGEPDGNQPQQVEPLVTTHAQSRRDRPLVFHPAGPGLRVDDVLGKVQLCAIARGPAPIADVVVRLELFAAVRSSSYAGSGRIDMSVSAATFALGVPDGGSVVGHRSSLLS